MSATSPARRRLPRALEAVASVGRRPMLRRRHKRLLSRPYPDGVIKGEYVTAGGIPQWVTVRGEHRSNPVLLVIHGGPGAPAIPFAANLVVWESEFTVVQWDQRGCGLTFGRNGYATDLSIERLAADGLDIAAWAARTLGQDRIVLLGSGAGTVVAARMARLAPEAFAGVVAANLMTSTTFEAANRLTRERLEAQHRLAAAEYLRGIPDDPTRWTAEQTDAVEEFAASLDPDVPGPSDLIKEGVLTSPQYHRADVRAIARSSHAARIALNEELVSADPSGSYEMPWLVVHGEDDAISPLESARESAEGITSPDTRFVVIPGAGHLAEVAEPEKVLVAMREMPFVTSAPAEDLADAS